MTKPYCFSWRGVGLLAGLLLTGVLPASAQQLFAPQIVYPGEGLDIVMADLNADGRPDVIKGGHSAVGVLSGTAGGGFGPLTSYLVGHTSNALAFGVAVADLNADGRPDIVSVNGQSQDVSVLLALPGGGFALHVDYPAGAYAYSVAIADFNADGQPDIVSANQDSHNVSVLLNTGNGTFGTKTDYAAGNSPYKVLATDVSGDGRPDLVVMGSQNVKVLRGQGNGTFANATFYPIRAFAYNMAVADLNADGYPDAVVPGGSGYAAQVLPGQAGGSFGTPIDYPLAGSYLFVGVADVNGDGRLDLAAGTGGTMEVKILLGQAGGSFALDGSYSVSNPSSFSLRALTMADVDGDTYPDLLAGWSPANDAPIRLNARPRITAFTPTSGAAGTTLTVTGTHLSGTTAVSVGGTAVSSFTVDSETQITAVVGSGTTGAVQVTNAAGTASSSGTFALPGPLTVSSGTLANPTLILAGTYSSLTIMGMGVAQLGGAVQVTTSLNVQSGGVLLTACQPLTGAGSLTLAAGATLGICDPAGLGGAPGTGAVQLSGPISLSGAATYLYNGSAAQVTGTGLPTTVSGLTTTNPLTLTLSQPLTVAQVLTVGGAGNLNLNGQPLLLASTAAGTALVVNSGTGTVQGTTATVQRYLDINTAGNGYRHYASPVQGETVNTLAIATYAPDFSGAPAYNASATPGLVTPFPTVFGYNESRVATANSNLTAFDKGWQAALSGEAMPAGVGFSANAPGTALVDFTGLLTTGPITRNNLLHSGADGGWQLLGNPYPAPLDWSTMTSGPGQSLDNVNAALYVFQSSGPYTGSYRTYLPGIGGGSPLVPSGAGFFVRTTTPGVPGTVRFTNANRVTTWGPQPAFGRSNNVRPQLALTLTNTMHTLADELLVYADPAATPGVDAQLDAAKLTNSNGLSLAALATSGEAQAIAGLPTLTASTVLPLHFTAPTAGTYTLAASALNLPTSLLAYLRDLSTGQQQLLGAQSLPLSLPAGLSTRYALAFAPTTALAAAPQLTAAQVAVFPNPASQGTGLTVSLPANAGQVATAAVLDALGRPVLAARPLPVAAGQATGTLPTAALVPGMYLLRLTVGSTVLSQKLVIE